MESPESWNLLTSSLGVSSLDRMDVTWAFLVVQGLVDSQVAHREKFGNIVDEVRRQGDITGPSEASRVAARLIAMGAVTKAATQPDPWAKIAQSRWETVRSWQSIK